MIRVERDGDLVTIVLDRAEKANAITGAMLIALDSAVQEAARHDAKAILLTGTGKVFSAGADLDQMARGLGDVPEWEVLSARIAHAPCLTIAVLNGTLAGGAFGMALACDLRLCVPEAQFFYPVMQRGYRPQPSDPKRLAALVGPARAKEIILCGTRIGADEALRWGLVNRITPRESLLDEAKAMAAAVLGATVQHGRALKAMF